VAEGNIGWQQGAIIAVSEIKPFIQSFISDINPCDEGVFIITSQDCDVLNDKESFIEMVLATVTETPTDTGLMHGRSVRDLYLPCHNNHCYHMNINARVWVASKVKEELQPNDNLPNELTNRLSGWLSFRYRREAFPDDFNDKLKKSISNLRRSLSKLKNEYLIAIYLDIEPDRKLEQGENYDVGMLVIIAEETPEAISEEYANIFNRFMTKSKNDAGTTFHPYINESVIIYESEVTVADIRRLKKWHLEDISSRTQGAFSSPNL